MLLCSEGSLCVSIDCNNSARSWHLELEVCIMWYRIESSEYGSSNSSLRKLSGDPKTTSSVIEPVQWASMPGMMPLKVVFVGLILEGSIPILHTVS